MARRPGYEAIQELHVQELVTVYFYTIVRPSCLYRQNLLPLVRCTDPLMKNKSHCFCCYGNNASGIHCITAIVLLVQSVICKLSTESKHLPRSAEEGPYSKTYCVDPATAKA